MELSFPEALRYGMTPDQYWEGDPWLFPAYREAARADREEDEWRRWELGLYVYEAVCRASPVINPLSKDHKALPWVEEPYEVTQRKTPEQTARDAEKKAHAEMAAWIMAHKVSN